MTPLIVLAAVAAAVVGALARWYVMGLADRTTEPAGFSRGLLLVNGFGSLVAGAVIGATVRFGLDPLWTTIVVTGFAGGLTTFSTWAVRPVVHTLRRRLRSAAIDAAGTVVVGLAAAALGYAAVALVP